PQAPEPLRVLNDMKKGSASASDVSKNKRARDVVLAVQRNRKQQREAIGILEAVRLEQQGLSAEESFLLAQLYEKVGLWNESRLQFLTLLKDYDKNDQFHAYFIRALLRRAQMEKKAKHQAVVD